MRISLLLKSREYAHLIWESEGRRSRQMYLKKLLDRSVPGLPRLGFSLVDVRDVAKLQVLAMEVPQASGHRFIASSEFYWMKEIATVLKQELGENARNVPSISIPNVLIRVFAL